MASQLFDTVITAAKDIIKYKAVSYVNTGDKTLDNLTNIFYIAIISLVFSVISYQSLLFHYYNWKHKKFASKLDSNTVAHYEKYMREHESEFSYVTWHVSGNDPENALFTKKIGVWFINNFGWKCGSHNPGLLDITKMSVEACHGSDPFDGMRKSFGGGERMIVYVDCDGMVGIKRDTNNMSLMHNNIKTFRKFIETVKKVDLKKQEGDEKTNSDSIMQIFDGEDKELGFIYKDRTFDMFVSRHKHKILNAVESFKTANTKGASFGGFGSYNLGIIVHGKPGTGKTMLIKAICNKLRRYAKIIDMRKIKTRNDFARLFNNNGDYVFVLDEFDCVQGVIKERSSDYEEKSEYKKKNPLEELKERHLAVLGLLAAKNTSSTEEGGKKTIDPLTEELNSIKAQIADYENRLTLDTILTTLDGIDEQRDRVIIATTNHIDRIDSALLRYGRFDLKIELGAFNKVEICEFLTLVFKDTANEEELEYLNGTKMKENHFTPTHLLELAMTHKSLRAVVDLIKE